MVIESSLGLPHLCLVYDSKVSEYMQADSYSRPEWINHLFAANESWIFPWILYGINSSNSWCMFDSSFSIPKIIPNVSLSTDLISGFCDETEEEHQDTLSLLREVQYDQAFMFAYSMRDGTAAYHKYKVWIILVVVYFQGFCSQCSKATKTAWGHWYLLSGGQWKSEERKECNSIGFGWKP